ncbi:MAG: hypothetical protein KDJ16_12240 [Hyphomicrobiales bacterium]|nr:hypothetical protein [Hyphomicrobiales bacterium]
MPQIVLVALIGAGLWIGWKALKKEMARVDTRLRETKTTEKDPVKLEKDPETGIYRPQDRDG